MSFNVARTSLAGLLRDSRGLALFLVIYTMAAFLLLIAGGITFSQLELKKTGNFKLSAQVIAIADAGLQHALALMPWGWDFDEQVSCPTPPCTLMANTSMTGVSNTPGAPPPPIASGFTYTITAESASILNNSIIKLNSSAAGPAGASKTLQAYVRHSLAPFTPVGAIYINAASAAPATGSSYFFDNGDSVRINGNDTNANNLLNPFDDAAGSQPALRAISATNSAVTSALRTEYLTDYNGRALHEVIGLGSEPSIGTVSDVLDLDKMADKFASQPGAVKFDLNGLSTDSTICPNPLPTPRPTPDPCVLGTAAAPQITVIKDNAISSSVLRGNVTGYGVLVVEGRTTIGETFKFYGMIVHKRSDPSHSMMFQDSARVYGTILLGSYDENDGKGKKARFTVKDFSRIYYSSQAVGMVESNWGALLPKPPRIFAWVEK